MRAIDRKVLRDLVSLKAQIAAICLVMACGVATFVMSLSMLDSLRGAQAGYYESHRFADAFARCKRAPQWIAGRIAQAPGVAGVETRVVAEVTLDVPGLPDPAAGRLVSIPDRGEPEMNRLHLRTGRLPAPGAAGEAVLGEAFAAAHGFVPGERLTAILNGRRQVLTIVGVALSPEFVYQIRAGEMLPDDRRFAVLWMRRAELAAAFDMAGAFNDLCVSFAPGACEPEVLAHVDAALAAWGGLGAHGRDEQTSHRYVSDELDQLRAMALVAPVIFLAVAAFLVQVVLSRLVGAQRDQIATLKAFGYSDAAVGLHYLKLVLAIVVAGSALGVAAGAWFGRDMTQMYARFFRFPDFAYALDPRIAALAVAVSAALAIAGAAGAVRRVVRLPPAEALRAEAPATYGTSALERLGLGRVFTLGGRMVLRHLERRPLQTALACLGIALAAAVHVLGSFVGDTVDHVMARQFEEAQRQDLAVAFAEPAPGRVLHDLRAVDGVAACEPLRTVAVRLRCGPRSRRVGIVGLASGASLFRVLDGDGRPLALPADGVVISSKLAEVLGAEAGGVLEVEVLEGARTVRRLPVAGVVDEYAGTNAYMDLGAVHSLLREQDALTGAFVRVAPGRAEDVFAGLKRTPRVAAVTIKSAALESFRRTLAENLLRMRTVNLAFATILAFGVVYNSARASLSEHARELASLRVLGFTRGEISGVLLGELFALTVPAIPLGLLLGRGFAWIAVQALDTQTHRFPLVVEPSTYGLSAAVTIAAVAASALLVRRRLDRLDLVAVLKARE